jgi:hypothetical protein
LTPEQAFERWITDIKQSQSQSFNGFSGSQNDIEGLGTTINAHTKVLDKQKIIIDKLQNQQNELVLQQNAIIPNYSIK